MRSRDGDRPLPFAVYALILAPLLWADEYIISYRSVVTDAILIHERLSVSHAMKKCSGDPGPSVFLNNDGKRDLKAIIDQDFDQFFSLMQRTALHIDHRSKSTDAIERSRTVLSMPPQCFTVDINKELVKMTSLK